MNGTTRPIIEGIEVVSEESCLKVVFCEWEGLCLY
jgi:hypothetical protein